MIEHRLMQRFSLKVCRDRTAYLQYLEGHPDELARYLLNTRPHKPIILCSGSIDQGLKGKARAAGIREFLAKSISMGNIAETVRKALD